MRVFLFLFLFLSYTPYYNLSYLSFLSNDWQIRISIVNYQLFRQIEEPGWKLSWRWGGSEVIWNMFGAEATEQGNCSFFRGKVAPHCCEKEPVIIDLLPAAPYSMQVANCCRAGILTSITQNPNRYVSAFLMHVGIADPSDAPPGMPTNFSIGVPGYTCGEAFQVPPTKFTKDQGRRTTQAFGIYSICSIKMCALFISICPI